MKKKVSVSTTVFLVLLACLVTLLATASVMNKYNYSLDAENASDSDGTYERYEEVKELVEKYYVGDIDDDAVEDGLIRGLLYGIGDKYAGYYTPDEAEERYDDLNGNMVGIGVSVVYNTDMKAIEIIRVYEDSPAMEAGLLSGDLVVTVGEDGESVSELGYDAAVDMLRGEEGTTAVFTVYRKNSEDTYDELNFSVVRKAIDVESVTYRLYSLDSTVGIIKIDSFDKDKTPEQFIAAVEALKAQGAEKLVMDVRFNPGGELTSVCEVLDYLLPEGPVIRTIDKDGNETVEYYSDANELDMPMAVLVNGSTASAGELFTAALKDYGKATVVGTTTYGKGCMQSYFNLSDGSSLCLTVKLYCPPFSDNYDGVGITPDVEVEICDELQNVNSYKYTDELDNQLAAAVATFN